jgi:hypothetical protein
LRFCVLTKIPRKFTISRAADGNSADESPGHTHAHKIKKIGL